MIWLPWWIFIEFNKSVYAPIDYLTWEYKHHLLKDERYNPPEIVVGDSLAVAAINPIEISEKLSNLSMSGLTPVDAWYFLRKYLSSGKKPERLFLSFGITHWQSSDTFKEHSLSFGFMNASEFFDFILNSKNLKLFYNPEDTFNVFKNWFPFNYAWESLVHNSQKNLALFEFYLIKLGLTPFQFNHVKSVFNEMNSAETKKHKQEIRNKMKKTRGHHLFNYNQTTNYVNPLVNYEGWNIHPLNDIYLRKILHLAHELKIKIVIDFVPNNINSWNKLSENFFKEKDEYFENLKKIYPDLIYSKLESLPENLFGDMDHFNEEGSRHYSSFFKQKYFEK
jgi:hypothetical protein